MRDPLTLDLTRLEGLFSPQQLKAHLSHHSDYYQGFLSLRKDLGLQHWSLQRIMGNIRGPLYNRAAQYWYHHMYWGNLGSSSLRPDSPLMKVIQYNYGSMEILKGCFIGTAMGLFSNGWYCVAFHRHYTSPSMVDLRCRVYPNAQLPMSRNQVPLLVIDLWEHTYYLDWKKDRRAYLQRVWDHIDWVRVQERFLHWRQDYQGYNGHWAL